MIGSVDLSQFSDEAIREIKESIEGTEKERNIIIDEKTIWITWGSMI